MSFSFSSSAIENLKSQVNIVDVVGRTVPLKRAGSNHKGVCPFHNEKTPSLDVYKRQGYVGADREDHLVVAAVAQQQIQLDGYAA